MAEVNLELDVICCSAATTACEKGGQWHQKSQRVAGHHLLAIAVTALAMLKAPLSGVFERSGLSGGLHAEIAEELLSVCYLTLMIVCMELHVHGVRGDERCDARGGRGGERGQ
ncbi:unnamed protein product, partial [Prorocentrum cordatum]